MDPWDSRIPHALQALLGVKKHKQQTNQKNNNKKKHTKNNKEHNQDKHKHTKHHNTTKQTEHLN